MMFDLLPFLSISLSFTIGLLAGLLKNAKRISQIEKDLSQLLLDIAALLKQMNTDEENDK